jgi:hypothetical protein
VCVCVWVGGWVGGWVLVMRAHVPFGFHRSWQDVRKLVAIDDAGWRQSRLRPVGNRTSKTASKFFAAQAIAAWPSALKEASMADIDRAIASMQAERCIALEVSPLLDTLFSWSVLDMSKLFKELLTTVHRHTDASASEGTDAVAVLVEPSPTDQDDPVTVINTSLAERLFALDVLLNIVHAMRTPSDATTRDLFMELQRVASENKKACEMLRASLVQRTQQASFLAFESAAVCITSTSDFAKLRERSDMQRATTFDATARQPMERQQRELEQVMELDHARLCCASKIEWRVVEVCVALSLITSSSFFLSFFLSFPSFLPRLFVSLSVVTHAPSQMTNRKSSFFRPSST